MAAAKKSKAPRLPGETVVHLRARLRGAQERKRPSIVVDCRTLAVLLDAYQEV